MYVKLANWGGGMAMSVCGDFLGIVSFRIGAPANTSCTKYGND